MNNNSFSERVSEVRKHFKLSQNELAREMKVDPATVYRWEKGLRRPSLRSVRWLERMERDIAKKGVKP